MTPVHVLYVWIVASVVMFAAWLIQRRTRNAGIVDAVWSFLMAATAIYYAFIGDGALVPRITVALLGGIWGLRLGLHVLHRVLHEPEDGRYRYLRDYWHGNQNKFLGFFMLQALSIALFSLPFQAATSNPSVGVSAWVMLAIGVWFISLGGESLADRQLAAFRADPLNRGRTCRSGLWRYSRHPNYFFEWLHWFTYVFLAVGTVFTTWLFSLLGPALMFASLYWVSGIPFTEAQALRTRGDDYREYQRTTSMLIPWFPKARKSGS